jgi:hypothetical protein
MSDFSLAVYRWVHLVSMAALLGPSLLAIARGEAAVWWKRQSAFIWVVLSLGAGLLSFVAKMQAGVPKGYHMWFGIKFLLALHIYAVAVLASGDAVDAAKRARLLKGSAWSGLVLVAIAGYLRYLTK